MSRSTPQKAATKGQKPTAYRPGDVAGCPLVIDRTELDEAFLKRTTNPKKPMKPGKWRRRYAALPTGQWAMYWETRLMPKEPTPEAALQWLGELLRNNLEETDRWARAGVASGDFSDIIRDAYRLLRAVAGADYPYGFDEPTGIISAAEARNHLHKIQAWLHAPEPQAGPAAKPQDAADGGDVKRGRKRGRGRNINGLMLDVLQRGKNEARGWTVRQWAKHLDCSVSSIQETPTWKDLSAARKLAKAEHALSKHQRSKRRRRSEQD
jgi:hypothetical protein